MLQSFAKLANPQEIWKFEHPNRSFVIDNEGMCNKTKRTNFYAVY